MQLYSSTNQPNGYRSPWDQEHSTYFWQIHLDRKNPQNSPNVKTITGYSKTVYQSEAQDKDYVLKRKICMLFMRGYFGRMDRVEFFWNNTGGILDKKSAPKILICYPYHYDFPELHHDVMYKKFGKWLELFYTSIKAGRGVNEVMPSVRKGDDKDYFIDPSNYIFSNPGQLYTHVVKLYSYGHAEGAINDFIRKVKQRNNWT